MSEIITYSDRKPAGTFCQLKLDDGKRVLISFTQTEIAIIKLGLGGIIPRGNVFKHDIEEFLEFFSVRVEQVDFNGSLLEAVVHYLIPCKGMEEVIEKLNLVIAGYDNPKVKAEVQKKIKKQVIELL